ncbi:hypothetical protein [Desulfovibrio gilichinskyi]|uniref:Uncharacterized protein n=1 Tax=Desulfovibrio gilichinskyi TaxID=1519643 RepID=A0A1X7E556_9BACT|nr:hypothetical protein [Desulfovibrio gilichinskyi]SMF27216.1 hypothetical protein SAMN06295933_2623 [Desulfovibrio gilichinskyi]
MNNGKTLTDRFLVALFRRGKAAYLPISYLKEQGDKVLSKGETDKLLTVLAEMTAKGVLEVKDNQYKLIHDPFA